MTRHARVDPSAAATTVTVTDDDAVTATATVAHDPLDPATWTVSFERAIEEVGGAATPPDTITITAQPGVVVVGPAQRAVWVARPGDVDSAPDAGWLAGQLADGIAGWVAAIGRAPSADDAISALSWLHRSEPEVWAQLARVVSPSGWLIVALTGALVTSPADAATTGWWSPDGGPRFDLLAIVDRGRNWRDVVPRVLGPGEPAGAWRGIPVLAG